jgi:hypothetical protein
MRESASDLIVKNCDEYYSYHALTGLTRASVGEGPSEDPWVLVARAARKMADRGDSMRVDRLKQVMIDLDPGFDEKDAGFSKFSKFVQRAGERGLIRLRRDDAGQFEVIAVEDDGVAGSFASPVAPPREERDRGRERDRDRDRNTRGRGRGRGRDREFPDRAPRILEPAAEAPTERDDDRDDVEMPATPFVPAPLVVDAPTTQPVADAPAAETSAPAGGRDRSRRGRGRGAPSGPPPLLPGQVVSVDEVIGSDAPREAAAETPAFRDEAPAARDEAPTEAARDEAPMEAAAVADEAPTEAPRARDEVREEAPARRDEAPAREAGATGGVDPLRNAYSLLQHATRALVRGPGQAARDGDVKRRMLDMQADFDEGRLGFGKFSRFLRQAHEDEVIDLRRTGEGRYEVALPAGGGRLPAPQLTAVAPGDETPQAADTEAAPVAAPARGRGRGRGRGGQDEAPSFLPGQVLGGDDAAPAAEDRAPEPSFEAQYAETRPAEPVAPAGDAGRTGMRGRGRGRGGVPSGPPPILPGQVISVPGIAEAAPEPTAEAAPAPAPVEAEAAPAAPTTPPLPTDRDGAVTHLSNYKGVGRKTAEAMVDAFGENVFRAMAEDPGAVRQLLGDRRSRTLLEQFEEDPLRPREAAAPAESAPAETAPAESDVTEAAPAATTDNAPETESDAAPAESTDAESAPVESPTDAPSDAPEASGDASDGEGQEEEGRTSRRSRGRRGGRGRGRERGEGAAEVDGAALADEVIGDTDPTLIGAAADGIVDAAPATDGAALADAVIGDTDPTLVGDAVTDADDAAGRARRSRRGRGRGRGRGEAADGGAPAQADAAGDAADLTFQGSDVVAEAAPAAEETPAPRGRRGRGAAAAAAAEPAAPEAEAAPAARRGRGRGKAGAVPAGEAAPPEAPVALPAEPESDGDAEGAAKRRGRRGGRGRSRAGGGNGQPAE